MESVYDGKVVLVSVGGGGPQRWGAGGTTCGVKEWSSADGRVRGVQRVGMLAETAECLIVHSWSSVEEKERIASKLRIPLTIVN
jgi:hypothetical protein